MPTRAELEDALKNADAAGDSAAATQLADAIHALDEQAKPVEKPAPPKNEHPDWADDRSWHIPNDYAAPTSPADKAAGRDAAAAHARYTLPVVASIAAPGSGLPMLARSLGLGATAAVGSMAADKIQGKDANMGDAAASAVAMGTPLSKAAGIKGLISDALRLGVSSEAGQQLKSIIESGQWKDIAASMPEAGLSAIIPFIAKLGGSAVGKLTGHVTPEEVAKANALAVDSGPKAVALAAGQRQDMKVIPSMVNRGNPVTDILESVGGAGATKKAFQEANDAAAMQATKRHAGIPDGLALDEKGLTVAEGPHAAVYNQLDADGVHGRAEAARIKAEIGTSADPAQQAVNMEARKTELAAAEMQGGVDIPAWKEARKEVARLKSAPYFQQDPEKIKAAQDAADALEEKITAYATAAGDGATLKDLNDARRGFAKVNDARTVMNDPGGSVNTRKVGTRYANDPGKMTGPLQDVGMFAKQFPDVVGTGANRMDPGNSGTNAAGVIALMMNKRPIAAAASLLNPRERARQLLMSKIVQKYAAQYNPAARTSADPKMVEAITRQLQLMQAHKGGK